MRNRGSRHRSVSIQIRLKVHRPKHIRLTKAFLADAIRYRINEGEDLPGVTITGIVWENPNKTYEYDDEPAITRALVAVGKMMQIDPSVFRPVRAD